MAVEKQSRSRTSSSPKMVKTPELSKRARSRGRTPGSDKAAKSKSPIGSRRRSTSRAAKKSTPSSSKKGWTPSPYAVSSEQVRSRLLKSSDTRRDVQSTRSKASAATTAQPSGGRFFITAVIVILLGVAVYHTLREYNVVQWIKAQKEWVQSLGYRGYLFVAALDVIAIALGPLGSFAVVLEGLAGAIFGFYRGLLLIAAAKTFAACFTFWLGRTLLRSWVEGWIDRHAAMKQLQSASNRAGWRFVALMRLSPAPSWVSNYGFAVTDVSFGSYAVCTALVNLPMIANNVNVGASMGAADNSTLANVKTMVLLLSSMLLVRGFVKALRNAAAQSATP